MSNKRRSTRGRAKRASENFLASEVVPCPVCAALVWMGDGSGVVAHLSLHADRGGDEGEQANRHLSEVVGLLADDGGLVED